MAVLLVVSMAPLALLAFVSLDLGDRAVRREVEARLRTTTQVSAQLVQNDIQSLTELTALFATRPTLIAALGDGAAVPIDHAAVETQIKALHEARPGISGVFVTDPSCRLTDVVPPSPEIVGVDFSFRDWCRGVRAANAPYVSEAYQTAITGRGLVVAGAAPVRASGAGPEAAPIAILAVIYSLDAIRDMALGLAKAQGVRLSITDQRGTLLAGPARPDAATGLVSARADRRVAAALRGDSGLARDSDGKIAAFGPVPSLGWTMVAEVPSAEAFAGVRRLRSTVLSVTAVVAAVLLAGVALLAVSLRRRGAAERVAAENEARSQAILTAATDAFVSMDEGGLILEWNPQAEDLFGWRRADVVGRRVSDVLIPPSLRTAHEEGLRTFLATGEGPVLNNRIEVTAVHRDGHEILVELAVWPSQADAAWTFNAFIHDISERKQHETELGAARDQALDASRLKSEFLANMSHEIRTPMNGVLGMTSLLLDTDLATEQRTYAETVLSSGEALLTILNDILDFSKIEAGKLDIESIDFDLRGLIEEVAELKSIRADAKGLELLCSLSSDLPAAVKGDPGRIRQILINLIGNAIKFTDAGEIVLDVSVEAPSPERCSVRFSVRDTGIGISEQDGARLFESFSQADASTTRRYGGTGLGLAISRQLVELMGGEIGLESEVGWGSTFWFTVPFELGQAPKPVDRRRLTGLRVLVVDDNSTNRMILSRFLTSWGMEPVLVDSGAHAMERLLQSPESFDLALIDLHMPDMDGLGLARAIGGEAGIPALPMILLTSSGQRGESEAATTAGMAGYLTKPVRQSQLYDLMTTVLGGALTPPVAVAPARRPATSATGVRCLVAEDNEVNQMVAAGIVRALGYEVDVVSDGAAAVAATRSTQYDVVLMDCQMPVLDGYEATARIREAERGRRRTPVIAVTASAMAADRERCLAAGMDDYVSKPVTMESLQAVIDRWLPEQARSGAGVAAPVPHAVSSDLTAPLDPAVVSRLQALGAAAGEDLYGELTTIFLGELPGRLDRLHGTRSAGDASGFERAAHTLRGSSASMGAARLADLCATLETGRLSGEALAAAMEQLEQEVGRVRTAMQGMTTG